MVIGIILVVILACYVIGKRNTFNSLSRSIKQQQSDIRIHQEKRAACLKDALSIAKLSYSHEVEGIEKLTASQQLDQLLFLGEKYPQLSSIAGYQKALADSSDLNRDIAAAKELLNGNIHEYNDQVCSFPALLVAKIFGYKEETYIDEENLAEAKKVDVSNIDISQY